MYVAQKDCAGIELLTNALRRLSPLQDANACLARKTTEKKEEKRILNYFYKAEKKLKSEKDNFKEKKREEILLRILIVI